MSGTVTSGSHVPPWGEPWDAWVQWANSLPNLFEINLRCLELDLGRGEFTLTESFRSLNPNGAVNGGLVVDAIDQCAGCVALTSMVPGSLPATATLAASYLRPAFPPLSLHATVSQAGRRLVFVTIDVEDRDGRVCVKGTGTMAAQQDDSPAA
jgi:uncharacterized protein (TIGR00369 family)